MENQPAFYAYNYGANIEIELNEQLRSLPKETRLRRNNEESKLEEDTSILEDRELISGPSNVREVLEALEEINYQGLYTKDFYKLRTKLE